MLNRRVPVLLHPGREMLANPKFDADVTSWAANGSSTLAWDADNGNGAALIDVTGAGGGIVDSQTLTASIGRWYRIEAVMRLGTYPAGSPIAINMDGVVLRQTFPVATYQLFTIDYQAVDTDINFLLGRGAAVTGTFYVDRVSLRAK